MREIGAAELVSNLCDRLLAARKDIEIGERERSDILDAPVERPPRAAYQAVARFPHKLRPSLVGNGGAIHSDHLLTA
jgi:hypothetical protein